MCFIFKGPSFRGGGISVVVPRNQTCPAFVSVCRSWLEEKGLSEFIDFSSDETANGVALQLTLNEACFQAWVPDSDTLDLSARLCASKQVPCGLESEILVSMLSSPIVFAFPSLQELESHLRVRRNIVEAASLTFLSFAAYEAERPEEYWEYDSDRGFVVKPGRSIIDALQKATQPADSDSAYSFSCYRATEYVIALGLAKEAHRCNPQLLNRLQRQAEMRAIKSGEFHDVFMREYGRRDEPLPARYYVPGDRVWFRNPDSVSSDVMGFEGSWVFYLGNGLFSDFWKRRKTFTLHSKSLEIYHWRNATYQDETGELRIDEKIVQSRIQETLHNPAELHQILADMQQLQDPRGVYANGGCIDPTREYPRFVQPTTSDIVLPDVDCVVS